MASTITLRRRIRSIKNTRQITQAQQMVAASKLRRAQEYAQRSRDYRELANEILRRLGNIKEAQIQPLYKQRPVKTRLYLAITSNSGLAGAYNANIIKELAAGFKRDAEQKVKSQVVCIGNKGAQFVRRIQGVELVAVFPSLGEQPTANDIRPILNTIVELYRDEKVDEIRLLYTLAVSSIAQQPQDVQLLPAKFEEPKGDKEIPSVTTFEPELETVIREATTRLVEAQIWQAIIESLASEHAMRMMAMKNATDNAKDLIDDYTLELNTARQAAITQELAEITGGAEALNG